MKFFSSQSRSLVTHAHISRLICILGEWLRFARLELLPASGVGLAFMYIFFVLEVKHALLIERLPSSDWLTPKANQKHFLCLHILSVCFRCFPKQRVKLLWLICSLLWKAQSMLICSKVMQSEQFITRQVEEMWNSFEDKIWILSRISDKLWTYTFPRLVSE